MFYFADTCPSMVLLILPKSKCKLLQKIPTICGHEISVDQQQNCCLKISAAKQNRINRTAAMLSETKDKWQMTNDKWQMTNDSTSWGLKRLLCTEISKIEMWWLTKSIMGIHRWQVISVISIYVIYILYILEACEKC